MNMGIWPKVESFKLRKQSHRTLEEIELDWIDISICNLLLNKTLSPRPSG